MQLIPRRPSSVPVTCCVDANRVLIYRVRIKAFPETSIKKPARGVTVFTARVRVKLLAVLTIFPKRLLVLMIEVLRAGVTTVVATLTFDAIRVVVLVHPVRSEFPPTNILEVVEIVLVKRRTVDIVLAVIVLAIYPTVLKNGAAI